MGLFTDWKLFPGLELLTGLKLFNCNRKPESPLIATFTAACENEYVAEINFYCH